MSYKIISIFFGSTIHKIFLSFKFINDLCNGFSVSKLLAPINYFFELQNLSKWFMKFNLYFSVNFNEQILLQLKKCSRLAHVSHMGVVSSCGHITVFTDYYYYYFENANSVLSMSFSSFCPVKYKCHPGWLYYFKLRIFVLN